MKKAIALLLILLTFSTLLFTFTACDRSLNTGHNGSGTDDGKNPATNGSITVNADLNNASVNLTDAKSLSIIVSSKGSQNAAKTLNAAVQNETEEEFSLKLAKTTENGDTEELKITTADGQVVTQEKLGLEIYKLYVDKEFTYVSFISSNVRKKLNSYDTTFDDAYPITVLSNSWNPLDSYDYDLTSEQVFVDITKGIPFRFNTWNYVTNEYQKSYIIHNATGKIYSMAQLPCFNIINGVINKSPDKFFIPSVNEQAELALLDIAPNTNISISSVARGSDDYYYIINDSVNLSEGNIVYIRQDKNTPYTLYRSEQGQLYIKDSSLQSAIKKLYKGEILTETEDTIGFLNEVDKTYFGIDIFSAQENVVLKKNNIYTEYRKSIGYNPDLEAYSAEYNNNLKIGENYYIEAYLFDEDTLVYEENNNLYIRTIDWAATEENLKPYYSSLVISEPQQIEQNVVSKCGFQKIDNEYRFVFYYEINTPTNVSNYILQRNDLGKIQLQQISSLSYDKNIITIQPLN